LQRLRKGRDPRPTFWIVRRSIHEYADPPYALSRLLRARGERPCGRAPNKRDELASPHELLTGEG
jgi:hypothetical protein